MRYWKPPPGMVKAPWYRRKIADRPSIVAEEAISPADESLVGWRLQDYYEVQDLVNLLPTVKEKIDFVNPYEREWKQAEKRWHRAWMAPLSKPRSAWAIPPTPNFFNVLDFYKYATKTRLANADEAEQEFEDFYKGLRLPTARFEKSVVESLALHLEREEMAKRENHPETERAENRAKFLRSLVDDAQLTMAHGNSKIADYRVSHCDRCESFWVRAGFLSLYEDLPVWEKEEEVPQIRKTKFTGDDRRRLGELAFTMRDKHIVQVRAKNPMKKLFDWNERAKLEATLFPPSVDVANECPGYEYDSGETHKFGRLAVKDITSLIKRLDEHWRCDSEIERREVLEECLAATAVASLFNWLNGQAHCLGHTQYTEILSPLSSQLVLSDGSQMFYFALGQLNTIAINIDVEGFNNQRTNYCCVSGPFKLYDEFDQGTKNFQYIDPLDGLLKDGLNPFVLERILQMCVV
uniref:Uncharacterized protein n=1 Tax=Globodera rostochiensis TaxID=31243 RepID=A0A914HBF7_GLORO